MMIREAPRLDRPVNGEVFGHAPPLDDQDGTPAALRGTRLADRFCAWSGRAMGRTIFTVFPLVSGMTVDDLPLGSGAVVLGVRRAGNGSRRVLWIAATGSGQDSEALRSALLALAACEGSEAHLHLLAADDGAREALVAALGFPRLATTRRAQTTSASAGASMKPPDWRCHRPA